MRLRNKLIAALGLALLAVSSAVAETAPVPAAPSGYVNPFDPNWWLATLNNMARLYAVPAPSQAVAPVVSAAPAAPAGYANVFDPNWWFSAWAGMANAAPSSGNVTVPAAPVVSAPAPAGSAYVPTQTPYGPVYVFNFADPNAWNKLFAQPFAAPGQK